MTEPEPAENGYPRERPRLPLWITIVSILLALGSVSVLVLVLYEETKGPAEILREFARRIDRHDCEGSYELLDADPWVTLSEEDWCSEFVPMLDEQLDADFRLVSATLRGDTAQVEIDLSLSVTPPSAMGATRWQLRRYGERSWRVVGPSRFTAETAEPEASR